MNAFLCQFRSLARCSPPALYGSGIGSLRKSQLLDSLSRRPLSSSAEYLAFSKVGDNLKGRLHAADHVLECFDDDDLICIACGGKSTVFLYDFAGGWACTSGLPTLLYNKLNGRQHMLPKAKYVALGSQDRYYISFEDGKSEWVGCEEMTTFLQSEEDLDREVVSVAFGFDWDSYFIVYEDGGFSYQNVPCGLDDHMEKRWLEGDIKCVSLGPAGEWFLQIKSGHWWANGMTPEADEKVEKHKNELTFLDFGDDGTYLLRHK